MKMKNSPAKSVQKIISAVLVLTFSFTNTIAYSEVSYIFPSVSQQNDTIPPRAAENAGSVSAEVRDLLGLAAKTSRARVDEELNPNASIVTGLDTTPASGNQVSAATESVRSSGASFDLVSSISNFAARAVSAIRQSINNSLLVIPAPMQVAFAYTAIVRSELRNDVPHSVSRVAVFGAGIIGKGVAVNSLTSGIQVGIATRHRDRMHEAIDPNRKDSIVAALDSAAEISTGIKALKKKKTEQGADAAAIDAQISEKTHEKTAQVDAWKANLHTFTGETIQEHVAELLADDPEILIESISEDPSFKKALFKAVVEEAERRAAAGKPVSLRMIGTTTSSLRVSDLITDLPDAWKKRVIGFHPFNPVPLMKLVEIAPTAHTDSNVVKLAKTYAKQMNKVAVVVKDNNGYIVNRVLYAYFNEALRLLRTGQASFKQIVAAAKEFGMPMDPFDLMDTIGHDTNDSIMESLHHGLNSYFSPDPIVQALSEEGRLGRKSAKGFYQYPKGKPEDDAEAISLFNTWNQEKGWKIKYDEDVSSFDPNRLLYVMVNEAARAVDDGTATLADVETAMRWGTYFPTKIGEGIRFDDGIFAITREDANYRKIGEKMGVVTSGPFGWALRHGIEDIVDQLDLLSRLEGDEYAPSNLLKQLRIGRLPEKLPDGSFEKQAYQRVWVKPRGRKGPATQVFEEGIISVQPVEPHQVRLRTILADINANGVWATRDFPIDIARFHKELGTVLGSAGLMIVTEVGSLASQQNALKVGDMVIMLSGTHDLLVLDAFGGSAQAHRSFRILAYEAKNAFEGSFGQETVLSAIEVVRVEDGAYDFEQLGPVGLVYPTVEHALNVLGVKKDQVLLNEGGAGGTGGPATQLAKFRGAQVITTVSSAQNEEVARKVYGADEVIYRTSISDEASYVAAVDKAMERLGRPGARPNKALFSSGQKMAGLHFAALREGDPKDPNDMGGQAAFFGAGATGFAHEHFGTRDDAPISVMFARAKNLRSNRYRVPRMRRVMVAGSDERAKESVIEAKKNRATVVVVARDQAEEAVIRNWGLLDERTKFGRKVPDGILRLDHVQNVVGLRQAFEVVLKERGIKDKKMKSIIPLSFGKSIFDEVKSGNFGNILENKKFISELGQSEEVVREILSKVQAQLNASAESAGRYFQRMPDPPQVLSDTSTADENSEFEKRQKAFSAYQTSVVLPFGEALGEVFGKRKDGTPFGPDVSVVLWDGEDGEQILNPLTFVGFFSQIIYPNDTSKLSLRYHAANTWMTQVSILLSRKVMLGSHYASGSEASAVVDWIMRGEIIPPPAKLFSWPDLPKAVESQGTGKNNILAGVQEGGIKTIAEAYEKQVHRDQVRNIKLALRVIETAKEQGIVYDPYAAYEPRTPAEDKLSSAVFEAWQAIAHSDSAAVQEALGLEPDTDELFERIENRLPDIFAVAEAYAIARAADPARGDVYIEILKTVPEINIENKSPAEILDEIKTQMQERYQRVAKENEAEGEKINAAYEKLLDVSVASFESHLTAEMQRLQAERAAGEWVFPVEEAKAPYTAEELLEGTSGSDAAGLIGTTGPITVGDANKEAVLREMGDVSQEMLNHFTALALDPSMGIRYRQILLTIGDEDVTNMKHREFRAFLIKRLTERLQKKQQDQDIAIALKEIQEMTAEEFNKRLLRSVDEITAESEQKFREVRGIRSELRAASSGFDADAWLEGYDFDAGTQEPTPEERVGAVAAKAAVSGPVGAPAEWVAQVIEMSGRPANRSELHIALGVLGQAGQYPFTRGIHPSMYVGRFGGRLPVNRKYSGFGTADETRELFLKQIEAGATGLSTAFDLPTQLGLDPTNELTLGEVGKAGISVASLKDYEALFTPEVMKLLTAKRIGVSKTINAPASILLAMFIAAAKKAGVDVKELRGTVQNDIIKEMAVGRRDTFIFPLKPSLRLIRDIFAFAKDAVPYFNTISVTGYHAREAGATAVEELVSAFVSGIEYLTVAQEAGQNVEEVAKQVSFFMNVKMNSLEEVAKYRAGRRIWAQIMKEGFGVQDPRAMHWRVQAYTGGTDLRAHKPHVNIVRDAIRTVTAVFTGAQGFNTTSFDEAIAIPTAESQAISLDTGNIVLNETGITEFIDPLGGAKNSYVETLTDRIERQVWSMLGEYVKQSDLTKVLSDLNERVLQHAYEETKAIDSGTKKVVGVNIETEGDKLAPPVKIFSVDSKGDTFRTKQIEALEELKSERDNTLVAEKLDAVEAAAKSESTNLMPSIIEAVEAYATIGEITERLKNVFGVADRETPWEGEFVPLFNEKLRNYLTEQSAQLASVPEPSFNQPESAQFPYTGGINREIEDAANSYVVNGFELGETGVTAAQELAWSLHKALEFVFAADDSKIQTERARSVVFRLNAGNQFLENVAKFRVARELWATLLKEKGIEDTEAQQLRIIARTDASSLVTEKSWNNIARGALQAFAAKLGGAQKIEVRPFDLPFGIRTRWSAWAEQLAKDTVAVLEYEAGLEGVRDPLGGSFVIEELTSQLIDATRKFLLQDVPVSASDITRAADMKTAKIVAGLTPLVGVTAFREGPNPQPEPLVRDAREPFSKTRVVTTADLVSDDPKIREYAARIFAIAGDQLIDVVRQNPVIYNHSVPVERDLLPAIGHSSAASAGLAVSAENFAKIRVLWGEQDHPLSDVPTGVGVNEFEITVGGADGSPRILDILTDTPDSPRNTITKHIAKFGEGIQQVEIWTPNIEAAAADIVEAAKSKTSGIILVDQAPRPGANGTTVFFTLVSIQGGKKVLTELVQMPRSELRSRHEDNYVAVLGAGKMGSRIAQVAAQNGELWTSLYDISPEMIQKAQKTLQDSFRKAHENGKLSEAQLGQLDNLLDYGTSLPEAVASKGIIIEAAVEDKAVKQALFRQLDKLAKEGAILATNTTTIPIEELAEAVSAERKQYVIGIHFQLPAHVNELVEIVVGRETSPETVERAKMFVRTVGKTAIVVKSQPGFVTSRLIIPVLNHALRIADEGAPATILGGIGVNMENVNFATIDEAFKMALGAAQGAAELVAKYIAPDIVANSQRILHSAYPDQFYAPSPSLLDFESQFNEARRVEFSAGETLPNNVVGAVRDFILGGVFLVAWQLIDENAILDVESPEEAKEGIDVAVRLAFKWEKGIFKQMTEIGAAGVLSLVQEVADRYSVTIPRSLLEWVSDAPQPVNMEDLDLNPSPMVPDHATISMRAQVTSEIEARNYHIVRMIDDAIEKYPKQTIRLARSASAVVPMENQSITYEQLGQWAGRFSAELIRSGIEKGDRVAVMMPNSAYDLAVDLGIWRAGAVRVPFETLWNRSDIVRHLKETGAKALVILTDYYRKDDLRNIVQEFPNLRIYVSDLGEHRLRHGTAKVLDDIFNTPTNGAPSRRPVYEKNIAQLSPSTGTSGTPKIVAQTHANIAATLGQYQDWLKDVEPGPAVIPLQPKTYGTHVVFASMLQGRPIILAPRLPYNQTSASFVDGLAQTLAESNAKLLFAVPAIFHSLAQSGRKFPGLIGLSRGSALGKVKGAFEEATGARLIEGYGLTEATSTITNPINAEKPGTVGKPNRDVVARVVKPGTWDIIAGSQEGELIVSAPQVMREYWNDPKATKEALTQKIGLTWVRTGDLATIDSEGYVTITGRTKNVIITGSQNVNPGEVEKVISNFQGVNEVAVVGINDPAYFDQVVHGEAGVISDDDFAELVGHFDEVVVAFVTEAWFGALKGREEEIIESAKESLAHYKAPKRVVIVSSLPRTGDLQKIDRNRLKSPEFVRSELREISLDQVTNAEVKQALLTAFGNDEAHAVKDLNYRYENWKVVKPDVTADEVAARLAWEYMPREVQNVFPGDNWKFMLLAARAGMKAPILLLDLEDAVATIRKELAREVIIQLIRLFKGEILTQEQVDFLKKNALQANDEKDPIDKYLIELPDDTDYSDYRMLSEDEWDEIHSRNRRFQLKEEARFHKDQMILFRPNNLRTKWSAGDYSIVFRAIGHLIDGIYMPKVFGPQDVRIGVANLRAIQAEQKWVNRPVGSHKVFVLTELPGGTLNAERILSIAPEVEEAQLGVVDYTAATGGKNEVQHEQFPYMRSALLDIVEAGKKTGKVAGTGITVKLEVEPTTADTEKFIKIGMNRKWSVHPNHLKGMEPFLGQFPPVIRKHPDYDYKKLPEIKLADLDKMAADSKPILPPEVFVPRDVSLARSIVSVDVNDYEALNIAMNSEVDIIKINLDSAPASWWQDGSFKDSIQKLKGLMLPGEHEKIIWIETAKSNPIERLKDIFPLLASSVTGIVYQNTQSAKEIRELDGFLSEFEHDYRYLTGGFEIVPSISDPKAIEQEAKAFEESETQSIMRASRRVTAAIFDVDGNMVHEAEDDPTTKGYNYYHSLFIALTAYSKIDAIDGYSSDENVTHEAERVANWGFAGKLAKANQVDEINRLLSPQRADTVGAMPVFDLKTDEGKAAKKEWLKSDAGKAYAKAWKNSTERDLAIIEDYAVADQDRGLGAVGFKDPVTGALEIVDAASARIPFIQMERAMKIPGILSDAEKERYTKARARLLLALRPGGRTEDNALSVFAGQKILGNALIMREWMVKLFAMEGDRNRFHLLKEYAEASKFGALVAHGLLTVSKMLARTQEELPGYEFIGIGDEGSAVESAKFSAPVKFDDVVTPVIEVMSISENGVAKLKIQVVNQAGKVVAEIVANMKPRPADEPFDTSKPTQSQIDQAKAWSEGVTHSVPKQIFDFTDSASPRIQDTSSPNENPSGLLPVTVTEDYLNGVRVIAESNDPRLVNILAAIKVAARMSAEAVPGHLLLNVTDLATFNHDIRPGDVIDIRAIAPAADKIKVTREKLPIVPVTYEARNGKNALLIRANTLKMMDAMEKEVLDKAKAGHPERSEGSATVDSSAAPQNDKALVPFAESTPKSGDFLLYGRANVAEGTLQFPEDLAGHEEINAMNEAIANFFKSAVVPESEKIDSGAVKVEDEGGILQQAGEMGLLGMSVPEEYGLGNFKKIMKTLADMWAWYANPSVGSLVRVHGGVGTLPIVKFGTEEQKRKYLPKLATGEWIGAYALTETAHGSDSLNRESVLKTKAVLKKDETTGEEYYEITGEKAFITNGRFMDVMTVFAMTGENEKSVFIVEFPKDAEARKAAGISISNDYHKTGLHGSSTVDVYFENARVPKENLLGQLGDGNKIGMSILNHGRTAVAAGSWGGALRSFERTLNWSLDRIQFGTQLANWGAVQETLADMEAYTYALESISYSLAGLFDGGVSEPGLEAAAAKAWGSEVLNRLTSEAVQKRGGAGFMVEEQVARTNADARVMTIFEGANEILYSQVIASAVLKYLESEVWKNDRQLLQGWDIPDQSPLQRDWEIVWNVSALVEKAGEELIERFGGAKAIKDKKEVQSYFMAFGKMVSELFALVSVVNRTQHRIDLGLESDHELNMTKVLVLEGVERIQQLESRFSGTYTLTSSEFELDLGSLIKTKHAIAQHTLEKTGKWERSELRKESFESLVSSFKFKPETKNQKLETRSELRLTAVPSSAFGSLDTSSMIPAAVTTRIRSKVEAGRRQFTRARSEEPQAAIRQFMQAQDGAGVETAVGNILTEGLLINEDVLWALPIILENSADPTALIALDPASETAIRAAVADVNSDRFVIVRDFVQARSELRKLGAKNFRIIASKESDATSAEMLKRYASQVVFVGRSEVKALFNAFGITQIAESLRSELRNVIELGRAA